MAEAPFDNLPPPQPASDEWRPRGNGVVVRGALASADVEALVAAPHLGSVWFDRMPAQGAWRLLDRELFARRPDVTLVVCNWSGPRDDFSSLDFLDELPSLRRLSVLGVRVADADALARHPGLVALHLHGRLPSRGALDFLPAHPGLRELGLGGFASAPRGCERIAALSRLELFRATSGFPTLSFLVPLRSLRRVELHLGANHDMESLGRVPGLEHLELVRVRRLADLSGLGRSPSLRSLRLDELRNVTSVAFAAGVATLATLWLVRLKGLRSLDGVAGHPGLEEVALLGERRLPDEELLRLATCPRLERLLGVFPPAVADGIRRALPRCRVGSGGNPMESGRPPL